MPNLIREIKNNSAFKKIAGDEFLDFSLMYNLKLRL